MTSTKTTKRALIASALSLLICVSMLIGSTFAWFTDSAATGVNTIVAGNLDIALYKGNVNEDMTDITYETTEVSSNTYLFQQDVKWEPGHTEVAYLKVQNLGDLAVKYSLAVVFSNEKSGTNVYGDAYQLSEVLRYAVLEIDAEKFYASRAEAQTAIAELESDLVSKAEGSYLTNKNDARYYAVVIYMPDSTDNTANPMPGTKAPSIDVGVSLVATQHTSESDSFDSTYDGGAQYPEAPKVEQETLTVVDAEALHAALEEAMSNTTDTVIINIEQDFTLAEGESWEPFGSAVGATHIVINGNNHTISGLNNPLMGATWGADGTLTVNDLTLNNCNIIASNTASDLGVGAFTMSTNSSGGVTFNNCHLTNSSVTCTDSYAGGFIGYTNGPANTFNNCSVTDCTIQGDGSTGAFAGQVGSEENAVNTITNPVVKNTTVIGERVDKSGLIVGSLNDGQITVTCDATEFSGNKIGYGDTEAVANNTTAFGRFIKNYDSVLTFNGIPYTTGMNQVEFPQ